MKFNKIFLILTIICNVVYNAQAQQEKKAEEICYNPNAKGDTSKRSIKSAAVGKIGAANITINYHSPGVRGRTIWGGLVPYNDVWVTGAHYATYKFYKEVTPNSKRSFSHATAIVPLLFPLSLI